MELAADILSQVAIFTKYARFNANKKRRETWKELVDRSKNMHIKRYPNLQEEIENAFAFVYDKKVLPSMRSLQFAGKAIEINPTRCYNCAFCPVDDWRAFPEIMFLLLGGTGIGFSVQRHHIEKLPEIRKPAPRKRRYLIGDSIEGWADAVKMLVSSYFEGTSQIVFDFSDIRPKGARLVTAGGKAPGPEPLKICLAKIESILSSKLDGDKLTSIEVHDIICHIADAVLAGGIRRAALISLFSADDNEMLTCKYGSWWELNPQRARANNSAVLVRHKIKEQFFFNLWEKIKESRSGEPGIYFTNDKMLGTNPCCEIALKPFQFCNLCEINSSNIESQEDLNQRTKAASFIGTLQASYTDFHYLRPIWQRTTEKDALLGLGLTGIASNKLNDLNLQESVSIAIEENERLAQILGINPASRITTIKPSGTTSLVVGSSSGIHGWHDKFYIRRMRFGKNESIYKYLSAFHPELIEDEYFRPHDTAVISVPQKAPDNAILRHETALELLERVKHYNINWIRPGHKNGSNTHNVSATISIRDNEWEEIGKWMWDNKEYYNGLSVLPYDGGTYKQAPFETISEEKYNELMESLTKVDLSRIVEEDDQTDQKSEPACAGGACDISF